jgi:multisubunit Na+/H+ antiporter MnhC subunit
MDSNVLHLLWTFSPFIIMLLIIGVYCIIASHNLIRILIGVELLIKAVTLLLVVVGSISAHPGLAQALIITLIVIEVVLVTVAVGVVIGIWGHTRTLDARKIKNIHEEVETDD